jgi:hypothetical protein
MVAVARVFGGFLGVGAALGCGGLSTRSSDDGHGSRGGASGGGAGSGGFRDGGVSGEAGAKARGGAGSVGGSGTAGTGAVAGGAGKRACGDLIDDMEDGSGRICTGEGRLGVWYAYNDGFGTQFPAPETPGTPILPSVIPGGRAGSTRAMFSRFVYDDLDGIGGTDDVWGAGIGLDLSFDGVTYGTYDASRYDGITFYARAGRPYTEFHLRVNTTDSTFVGYGGKCPQEFCDTYTFYSWQVGVDWARYSVLFTELHAYIGNRGLPEFHRERLTNVQFLFVRYRPPYPDTEIWIDDVAFFRGAKPVN